MTTRTATTVGLMLLASVAACAAGAPAGDRYFPLVDGRALLYRTTHTANGEAKPPQDTELRIARRDDGSGKPVWVFDGFAMEAREDGVYRVGVPGTDGKVETLPQPYKFIGNAPRVGEKWSFKDGGANTAATVLGIEKVKTEAGEFDAAKVFLASTESRDGEMRRSQYTRWFAPGVGLVKETGESRTTTRDGKAMTTQWSRELIERPRT